MPDDMGELLARPTINPTLLGEIVTDNVLVYRYDTQHTVEHPLRTQKDAVDIISNYDGGQTLHHCLEVAGLIVQAGRERGWSEEFIHEAYSAAQIHDLGKANAFVIDARGSKIFTPDEKIIFRKQHSDYGAKMMKAAGFSRLSVLAARYHHFVTEIPEAEQITDREREFLVLLCLFDIYSATRGTRDYQDLSVQQVLEKEWEARAGIDNVNEYRATVNKVLGNAA